MINWCETEESLKRLYTPDLGSSQAVSTARESKQTQGSRKQRESSIKWSTHKDISLPTRERLTKKERHHGSNQQYPIIVSIKWRMKTTKIYYILPSINTIHQMDNKELISAHPNKLHNLSKSKKATTTARTEDTSGRGFFSCTTTMSFLTPHHSIPK